MVCVHYLVVFFSINIYGKSLSTWYWASWMNLCLCMALLKIKASFIHLGINILLINWRLKKIWCFYGEILFIRKKGQEKGGIFNQRLHFEEYEQQLRWAYLYFSLSFLMNCWYSISNHWFLQIHLEDIYLIFSSAGIMLLILEILVLFEVAFLRMLCPC